MNNETKEASHLFATPIEPFTDSSKARQWYLTLSSWLKDNDFQPSDTDPCLFVIRHHRVKLFVAVYVDDILTVSNDQSVIHRFQSILSQRFKTTHDQEITGIVGIGIQQLENGSIHMTQKEVH